MAFKADSRFPGIKRKGISAKTVIIPAALIILVLHALIIFNTIRINRIGQQISQTTSTTFTHNQLSKQAEQAGDMMSDYARLFVNTGNVEYIGQFYSKSGEMNGQIAALREILNTNGNTEALSELGQAVAAAGEREALDLKAMHLAAAAMNVDVSAWPQISGAVLPDDAIALSAEEKQNHAVLLLGTADYLEIETRVHLHVDAAVRTVSMRMSQTIAQLQGRLQGYQTLQWVLTFVIIIVLLIMCFLLFILMLVPLERSVAKVQQENAIETDRGFSELRRLAASYNDLLYHRRSLENDLRRQSQTDALTELPNRHAFENYIRSLNWNESHDSITIFSLDVNGLKITNDTLGHLTGDDLLQRAAKCILAVFGDENGKNCFRFGGDEFAAIWIGRPESEIVPALAAFEKEQGRNGISVSVGYAFAPDMSRENAETLYELADKSMYEKKMNQKKL